VESDKMLQPTDFFITRTSANPDLPLPTRATPGSAGIDISSNITTTVKKGGRTLIPTGIKIALPFGYEAQLRPRSGLALKHGITVLNTPGTIDADYRGELHVLLINHGDVDFEITRGDRIAQLVIAKVEMIDFTEVDDLSDTQRGAGGYGSTGL